MTQEATCLLFENQIYTGIIQKKSDNALESTSDNTHANTFCLIHDLGVIHAKKATSCLLVPEVGDKVAFLQVTKQEYYILHILEREESVGKLMLPHHTTIQQETIVQEETDIHEETTLKLYPQKKPSHLEIQSNSCALLLDKDLEIQAKNIKHCATNINLTANHTVLTGNTLTTRFKSFRQFCDHAINNIKKYMGIYGRKIDKIEDFMEIEAKQAHMNIEENFRFRSQRASMKSKESMNIDAKHINIG